MEKPFKDLSEESDLEDKDFNPTAKFDEFEESDSDSDQDMVDEENIVQDKKLKEDFNLSEIWSQMTNQIQIQPISLAEYLKNPTSSQAVLSIRQLQPVKKKVYEFAGSLLPDDNTNKQPSSSQPQSSSSNVNKDPSASSKPSPVSNVPLDVRLARLAFKFNIKTSEVVRLTTLEKSKLDWNTFVDSQEDGLKEKLKRNRADGYIEKVQFLNRTDDRKEEIIRSFKKSTRR